jgi:putative tricarboxylic transport membrane protein
LEISVHALLSRAVLSFAALLLPATGFAQSSMRIVIPSETGTAWDRAGRALGSALLSVKAASQVEYANRGGAGGTQGLAAFLKSAKGDPDAIFVAGQDLVVAAELDATAPRLQDATPLARLASSHYAVFVPAGSPHRTMADLARAFKADPGAIAWDAGARGGPAHLLAAYLAKTVGADPSKVRLAASPQEATAGIAKLRDLSGPLKAGRVRALAVTSPAATAGIASLKEQGINLVFANWHGLLAGPGLKPSQRDELLSKVKAATATPAWKAFLEDEGWTPVWLQGSDYARFLDEESRSLGYLAKPLGLRPRR